MVALMTVMIDEGFEIARQEVVFQQDAVLQSLMSALDLALGSRMIRRAARLLHGVALQLFGQITRDTTGYIIAQQSWFVSDMNLSQPDAPSARSNVSINFSALRLVQGFHDMM